jgi:hypothetical protein
MSAQPVIDSFQEAPLLVAHTAFLSGNINENGIISHQAHMDRSTVPTMAIRQQGTFLSDSSGGFATVVHRPRADHPAVIHPYAYPIEGKAVIAPATSGSECAHAVEKNSMKGTVVLSPLTTSTVSVRGTSKIMSGGRGANLDVRIQDKNANAGIGGRHARKGSSLEGAFQQYVRGAGKDKASTSFDTVFMDRMSREIRKPDFIPLKWRLQRLDSGKGGMKVQVRDNFYFDLYFLPSSEVMVRQALYSVTLLEPVSKKISRIDELVSEPVDGCFIQGFYPFSKVA